MAMLRARLRARASAWPTAFGRWLERVLGDRGLVVYDSSDPAAKPLVGSVFTRELSTPGETARRAARAGADLDGARLSRAGPRRRTTALALFHLDGGRRPIRQQDGQLRRRRRARTPRRRSQQAAAEHPAGFSPNVLLRPIVQDTLFPTICYVAGPNELAYLGQLRGVYEHFGVPMPLMYPRASATLRRFGGAALPHQVRAAARERCRRRTKRRSTSCSRRQIPPSRSTQSFDAASRADRRRRWRGWSRRCRHIDPTLEGAGAIDARPDAARPADAARQDDPGGQAARRDAAAPVHAHAGAGLPRRPSAGTRRSASCRSSTSTARRWSTGSTTELPLDLGHHWVITI